MNYLRSILSILLCAGVIIACVNNDGHTESAKTEKDRMVQVVADPPQRQPDVPYVPTPQEVVDEMLKVAKVTKNDVIYDLGSGDGRIVITAAKVYGARGVGVDINPTLVKEAQQNAEKAGVTDRTKFLEQDLFQTDISEATVVTLYLLPSINLKLRPKLFQELKPGTRVVSHSFDMGDWKADKTIEVDGRKIYYWVIPAKAAAQTSQ